MDQGSSGGVLAGAAVARKLATKLATRVGLVFLVPRLAPWRYVRGMADISGALAGGLSVVDRNDCQGRRCLMLQVVHADAGCQQQLMRAL